MRMLFYRTSSPPAAGRIRRIGFSFPAAIFLIAFIFLSAALDAEEKVNREVFRWKETKTVHFTIYSPEGSDKLTAYTVKYAEEAYRFNSDYLEHETSNVIPVIVYPSPASFQENTVSDEIIGEGVGGFTEMLKGRVVVPFSGDYGEYRHVISHEITHAMVLDLLLQGKRNSRTSFAGTAVPLWMMEGIAEYMSSGYEGSADMVMRDAVFNDRFVTLEDLTRGRSQNIYLYYKEGQSFFYFLEKKYGKRAAADLFKNAAAGGNLDKAMKHVTGKTLKELDAEWLHFFKLLYMPVSKGKSFDQDIGREFTDHVDDYSSHNSFPAVSPDGTKIAFISNRGIYSNLSVMVPGTKKVKSLRVIAEAENNSSIESLHLLDNSVAWTPDGKGIMFCARSYGRDVIMIADGENGSITEKISLPFRSIRTPAVSADGKMIAFIGQDDDSSDIYVYDRKSKICTRLTKDRYTERDPRFDPTGSFLVYSSNGGKDRPFDSDEFALYRLPLKGGKTELLTEGGRNFQPSFSPDGGHVLFISDRNGIFNIYRMNLSDKKIEKITDVLNGIFSPVYFPDGKKIAYTVYHNLGYDIAVRDVPEPVKDGNTRETVREKRSFLPSYIDYSKMFQDNYSPSLKTDSIDIYGMIFGGSNGLGLAGYAGASYSDMLSEHRVNTRIMYYGYEKLGGGNADISYYLLKYRTDFGLGIFTQTSPFGIATLDTINDLIYNVYSDTISMKRYGAYAVASYPFTKFLSLDARFTTSRYEWDYDDNEKKNTDVYANMNTASLGFGFDNVVWSFMGPADGTRLYASVNRTMNLTGQDYDYTSVNLDMRKYFFFRDYYIFAFRGAAGRTLGRDSDSFKYMLGGFTTLRGYDWAEFEGKKMFMLNAEFRFITVEGIKFGFPLYFGVRGIGGVLFADAGAVWDDRFVMKNRDGSFRDLKTDIGFGFRLAFVHAISLKLDFAWPYNNKSFNRRNILFSIGMDY
jgi:Tol biopolymer transport system component